MTNITRLFDFAYYQLDTFDLDRAFATKVNGAWEFTSSKDYISQSNNISKSLLNKGVNKNDKIAVISSTNRTEWNLVDIGVLQLGAQTIPIYPTISAEDYEYVINHSESIYCFVSDIEVYEKVKRIQSNTNIKEIYSFDHING